MPLKPEVMPQQKDPVAVELTVSFGVTLNIGKFESIRIDVGHTVRPGTSDEDTKDVVYSVARELRSMIIEIGQQAMEDFELGHDAGAMARMVHAHKKG